MAAESYGRCDSAEAAVCGCGICKQVLVDEDGLCVSCGVWPILVADRTSAEEVVGLREDVDAATARAEAAEARAAQAEAAGYRRAIDEACVALGKRAGYLRNFALAEEIVRALAPVEPVSHADGLPGGAA